MPRRVLFRRYGEPSVLEIDSIPVPSAREGEILVDVAFAGVNYADVLARRGLYKWADAPPTCVGFELSGRVRAVGPGAVGFSVGDRVMAVTRFGGYADVVAVDARRAWTIPDAMPLEHAAAIPAVYLTAWQAVMEVARARAGESILIQAVAGGVGLAALQLAKQRGLVTYGTASTEAKLDIARQHGLDHGMRYAPPGGEDFEARVRRLTGGRGVDVVLDSVGGSVLRAGYRSLARGGRLVTIGAAGVAPASWNPTELLRAGVDLLRGGLFHPFQLIEDNRSIGGVQVLLLWDDVPRLDRGIAEILGLYTAGEVAPAIDSIVPLESARLAHERLESRASAGKLLLRCASAPTSS